MLLHEIHPVKPNCPLCDLAECIAVRFARKRWFDVAIWVTASSDAAGKSQGRPVIVFRYGISSRSNFVSSLRKDCRREVDACTPPCGAPDDAAHQSRSLDVEPVF